MKDIFIGISVIIDIFLILKHLELIRKEFLFKPYKWKIKYSIVLFILSALFFIIGKFWR